MVIFFVSFFHAPDVSAVEVSRNKSKRPSSDTNKNPNPHHFFNAELLKPEEKQIGISGNFKVGVNKKYELGSQGLILLTGVPNVYLKHRMFKFEKAQTSFVNHTFYVSLESESVDQETLEVQNINTTTLMSAMGIVTTHKVSSKANWSWGVYDLYLSQSSSDDNTDLQAHFITPSAAVDYRLSDNWVATATLAYTAYITLSLESDSADFTFDSRLFAGSDIGITPLVSFLTTTYTNGSFNIEFGGLVFTTAFTPYINLFWRFM